MATELGKKKVYTEALFGKEEKKRREAGGAVESNEGLSRHSRARQQIRTRAGGSRNLISLVVLFELSHPPRMTPFSETKIAPSCHTRHIIAISCMYALDE